VTRANLNRGLKLAKRADANFDAGRLDEALPDYGRAVTLLEPGADQVPKAFARACIRLGLCQRAASDLDAGAASLERAAAFALARGLGPHRAEACRLRASLADQRGHVEVAERWLRRALSAYTDLGSVPGSVATLIALGRAERARADLESARDRFAQAEQIAAEAGFVAGRADALANLGNIHRIQADLDAAQACFEAVLAVARQIGHLGMEARALTDLGNVASARGERDEAVRFYQEARGLQKAAGDAPGAAANACNVANLWAQSGRLREAAAAYRGALAALRAKAPARTVIDVSLLYAQTLAKLGQLEESHAVLVQASERAQAIDYAAGERRVAATLAAQDLVAGNVRRSRERHATVVAAFRDDPVPADEVAVLLGAVDADLSAEEYAVAKARLERAELLVETRGLVRYRALLHLAQATLQARRANDPVAAADELLTMADVLDSHNLPVEALATRLDAADFVLPQTPADLVEAARALGSKAAELDALSLQAQVEGASIETFVALRAEAEALGMIQLMAAIARRQAQVHARQDLEALANAATEAGALWEARLCRI